MFKKRAIPLFFVLLITLVGCRENNLDIKGEVNSIEVYTCCGDGQYITEITDQSFIDDLVKGLEHADTGTTANLSFLPPEYKLYFKAEDETVHEMGYFAEMADLNLEGRYWDFSNKRMYGIDNELPVDG